MRTTPTCYLHVCTMFTTGQKMPLTTISCLLSNTMWYSVNHNVFVNVHVLTVSIGIYVMVKLMLQVLSCNGNKVQILL